MNFFKNPIGTISNAAEINRLKDKRTNLEKEKKDFEKLCEQYDSQVSLKNKLEQNITICNEILSELKALFIKYNINYEIDINLFKLNNTNNDKLMYREMYDSNTNIIKLYNEQIEKINNNIHVNKNVYEQKIIQLSNSIDNINNKLKNVREKQFGK
jgi:hypothetical protein